MNRILFAGLSSGSGKPAVTCACLRALQKKGISAASFKCGPDYIDPMFHQRVLGIPGENLDLFLPVLRLCEYHISVKFYSLIFLHIEDLIPEVSRLVHDNSSD